MPESNATIYRRCHVAALDALRLTIDSGEGSARKERITLLVDTADICRTAADFAQRGSAHHRVVGRACAEVCRACRELCEASGEGEGEGGLAAVMEACRAVEGIVG